MGTHVLNRGFTCIIKQASLLNHISVRLGAEFVRVEFGPRIYGGRVCQGPSLLGAEFVRGRDVPESF